MSKTSTTTNTGKVKEILDTVGTSLPERTRVKGTKSTRVKLVPTGELTVNVVMDNYTTSDNKNKNVLAGKKVVLIFGKESHTIFRTFLVPKLACIYQNITLEDDKIEFLYVSVPEETKPEFDRFTKSHPWPCVPWDQQDARAELVKLLYTPLNKPYGGPSVVVLDENHTTILNRDAEPYITRTHDETGKNFPWVASAGENAAAVGLSLCLCTIL